MSVLWLVALTGIIGGIAIGLQVPLASLLGQRLGVLESIFIIHVGGAIGVGLPLLALGGGKLGLWSAVPWYALAAGLLGIVVIGAQVFMVPRIGVAGAVILIVAGQFTIATVIDHYGWLGADPQPISIQRLAGLGLIFAGVWIVLNATTSSSAVP